ncbi:heavy-metal-associated domain-containing protein, partial [Erythrobacter donghaensis]
MKKILLIGLAVLVTAGGGIAYAVGGKAQDRPATATAQRQTTFAIENMTCATCPITVKKAMEGVPGVTAVRAFSPRFDSAGIPLRAQ